MTDVELDERVTALAENDGGGDPQNGSLKTNLCKCIHLFMSEMLTK